MEINKNFTPVLLGLDLCAYSVARAFHEYSGEASYAFGRYKCGITGFSKIVKTYACAGLDDIKIAGPALFDFAMKNRDKSLLLIPCSDTYTEIAAIVSERFSDYYTAVIPPKELRRLLKDKITFYGILEKHKIPFPKTVSVSYARRNREEVEGFSYPAVVKPADSAHYWQDCKFSGMRKVYFVSSAEKAWETIEKIYCAGYRGKIALQKRIGDESAKNSVLTVFCQRGRAVRAVYGRVILEEVGMTSHGNHAAIITEPITPLCEKLIKMLESIEYHGFANFDVISDGECEYVLEVNLRQGRSCDYMRAAGVNIARLFTMAANEGKIEKNFDVGKVYWRYPSHNTVRQLSQREDIREAEALRDAGLEFSALEYQPDIESNFFRRAYVDYHSKRLNKTFIKNARRGYL